MALYLPAGCEMRMGVVDVYSAQGTFQNIIRTPGIRNNQPPQIHLWFSIRRQVPDISLVQVHFSSVRYTRLMKYCGTPSVQHYRLRVTNFNKFISGYPSEICQEFNVHLSLLVKRQLLSMSSVQLHYVGKCGGGQTHPI